MTTSRRSVLAGLAATAASPALAQFDSAIKPQSDPWAQVNPYDDPRNGFPSATRPAPASANPGARPDQRHTIFQSARGGPFSEDDDRRELAQAVRSFAPCQEDDGGPVPNRSAQDALAAFFRPLAAVTDRKNFAWTASIARSPEVNAWTVGAGLVSVNAGLIAACEHPGELAAVLAHEAGHVDMGHIIKGNDLTRTVIEAAARNPALLKDIRSALGGGIILKDGPVALIEVLRAGHSRADEFEADEHSMHVLSRAGLDPQWSIAFMTKLTNHGRRNGHHLLNDLVIGHPPGIERIEALRAKITTVRKPPSDIALPGWEALKKAFPTPPEFRSS